METFFWMFVTTIGILMGLVVLGTPANPFTPSHRPPTTPPGWRNIKRKKRGKR